MTHAEWHSAYMRRPDRWADWLISGRARGLDQRQTKTMTTALNRVRNRVLAGARIRKHTVSSTSVRARDS
jgi:hypothetical protein